MTFCHETNQECADGDLLQQINKCKQERAYLREALDFGDMVGMLTWLKSRTFSEGVSYIWPF